LSYRLEDAMVV